VQLPVGSAGRRWLEIALDYRCNLRCVGCHACQDTGESLTSGQALALLRSGRDQGIARLWLGGGEPTLRGDLLGLVRAARKLGYVDVVLQTNGTRLAYPSYRDAVVAAGVTEVRFNVKSHRADVHDRLSGGEDVHRLMIEAIDGLAASGVRLVADVLLTRSTAGDLPATVSYFGARGIKAFVLWLLSAADSSEASVAAEVPRIRDIALALAAARDEALRSGATLASLHTPPCTLPAPSRDLFAPASRLSLLVVGPDARPFALEESPFEGGAYVAACGQCSERAVCGGPRADYLRIHGDSEFVPLGATESVPERGLA
jgi:MoaA/NifB/PqqE/SkfB family radical SAM enzyme